jgi:hypothetical protein
MIYFADRINSDAQRFAAVRVELVVPGRLNLLVVNTGTGAN